MAQLNISIHNEQIIQPFYNSAVYANSFFPRIIRNCNLLHTDLSNYETVDSFNS